MNKNHLFILLIFIAVIGCTDKPKKIEIQNTKFDRLSFCYTQLSADTFDVYAMDIDEDNIEHNKFKFKGIVLDSTNVAYLNSKFAKQKIVREFDYHQGLFACFKININDSLVGLITRIPGMYVSSAIELFVFDIKKDSLMAQLPLADIFGDAGDASQFSTCILKKKDAFSFISYGWASYDHRVDADPTDTINPVDTLIDHWYNYNVIAFSKNKFDTLSKDSAKIIQQYPSIIRGLSAY